MDKKVPYQIVPKDDLEHEDESTNSDFSNAGCDIEAHEYLTWKTNPMHLAKSHMQRTTPRRRSCLHTIRECWWVVDTVLFIVIVGLLVILLLGENGRQDKTTQFQIGGDFTGGGPIIPIKFEKFEPDFDFVPLNASDFFAESTLQKWQTIMPKGTGFPAPGQLFSTTSMTHQLHCLYMMARIYHGVASNRVEGLPNDYHFHFMHCVDYIRQGAMCTADLAIEVHEETDSDDFGPQDGGWSGHHVCKDYSKVKAYLEEQIHDGARVVLPVDD